MTSKLKIISFVLKKDGEGFSNLLHEAFIQKSKSNKTKWSFKRRLLYWYVTKLFFLYLYASTEPMVSFRLVVLNVSISESNYYCKN